MQNNQMKNENYIFTYTIGQVIKRDGKYWQITHFTNPSTGDWFIADSDTIMCFPSYLYFDNDDRRYIVQEVSITPVTVKVNVNEDKNNEKLPVGTITTINNAFYEVTDYRVPKQDEYYVYPATDNVIPPCVYRRRGTTDCEKSYNIVTKIQPYKLGQVVTVDNKSYTVVDYAYPKDKQFILNRTSTRCFASCPAVRRALFDWQNEKAFILEPIEPPDPEAIAYKPGQLIVRDRLVYRVIAYRKAKKGEYMTYSGAPTAVICLDDESYSVRWVVEPYCVS